MDGYNLLKTVDYYLQREQLTGSTIVDIYVEAGLNFVTQKKLSKHQIFILEHFVVGYMK